MITIRVIGQFSNNDWVDKASEGGWRARLSGQRLQRMEKSKESDNDNDDDDDDNEAWSCW